MMAQVRRRAAELWLVSLPERLGGDLTDLAMVSVTTAQAPIWRLCEGIVIPMLGSGWPFWLLGSRGPRLETRRGPTWLLGPLWPAS